jgi:hypothetical protein
MDSRKRFEMIRRGLGVFIKSGRVAELRVPESDRGPQRGLFTDLDEMAKAAARLSNTVPGIYFTMNPLKQSAKKGAKNWVGPSATAVKDDDVDYRLWLLLDFDPVRPGKSPATDAEHQAALKAARECRAVLRRMGWPDPILADSGNGAHLLYRIFLINNEENYLLVKKVLAALALRFSILTVTLDTANSNASRLIRVYGTYNCKGESTVGRPYRRAQLLEIPERIAVVSDELLARMAEAMPAASQGGADQPKDIGGWLKERNVPVYFDAPWNNGGHKWILKQCPWKNSHKKSAFIVQFADGGIAASCLHNSCRDRNWPQMRRIVGGDAGSESQSLEPGDSKQERSTQAEQLITTATPKVKPFRTPEGKPYASIGLENHTENHAVDGAGFREFLEYSYFRSTKRAAQPRAVHEAVMHFSAVARFNSPTEPVFIRVGRKGAEHYLDLVNDQWQAIKFGKDGWGVVQKPRVRFRRVEGMQALPRPIRKGDINDLREFLNIPTDEDWLLFVTDLVSTLFSAGPYAVLVFHGEAGSAKTTATRVFRQMIDPNVSPLRAMPKDERDLMVMASNNWVLTFDNLSFLPARFSDDFCRLSTGAGFGTRSLYTNAEETIFGGQRPIVLNGIEELATRTDLLDRSLLIELPAVRNFRAEGEFWRKFNIAHPQLLGALLDLAVTVVQNLPKVKLSKQPRMADFARLGTAAEAGLGLSAGAFMRAYERNREKATALTFDSSPVANLIRELADERWKGTATALLSRLSDMTDQETRNRRSWPKTPKVLSGMVRRLATALRTAGVEIGFDRDETRNRNRTILIRRLARRTKP